MCLVNLLFNRYLDYSTIQNKESGTRNETNADGLDYNRISLTTKGKTQLSESQGQKQTQVIVCNGVYK